MDRSKAHLGSPLLVHNETFLTLTTTYAVIASTLRGGACDYRYCVSLQSVARFFKVY